MLFWKRKATEEGEIKLPRPSDIPGMAGRHMVTEMKKDPDWVWKLKGVVRPADKKPSPEPAPKPYRYPGQICVMMPLR
jgi:hypothetical protein